MDPKIKKELESEELSETHKTLLADTKALVDMSRKKMQTYYAVWDHNIDVFQGVIHPDAADNAASDRKEPEKMVVPIAYSQVMTFVAFCFTLFTQRERMFELLGMSDEDHKPAKIGEAFLHRDLAMNQIDQKLFQFLLDVARCSLGVFKCYWTRETQMVEQEVTKPMVSILGLNLGSTTTKKKVPVTKFLGNRICNVSPYRFFPDTRLPLSRFQEGEFCASEDEYSYTSLKQLEHNGVIAGLQYVKSFTEEQWKNRGDCRSSDGFIGATRMGPGQGSGQSKGAILITEVERAIIPSEYKVDGKPVGEEKYPVKYLIWIANDQRIVRFEPMNYVHDEFTYTLAEFTPDQHNLINMSLSDTIDSLQAVITWFINSHITSVRKVISNYLIVDPSAVEMKDINDRKPVIRLKGSAAGGIDRFIKQLTVSDVTSNHLADVEMLQKIVQIVTGISDNLMGQFHTGRRSAQEARNVNSGAVSRLKMLATIIFKSGLEPLARQMLSNLRDGLDEATMVRLVGVNETAESGAQFAKADKSDLAGNYDFEVFDGTLPSEKAIIAQAIQEYLAQFVSNPEAAVALQVDPKALMLEAMQLRGIRNPQRFSLKPLPPQQNGNMPPAPPNGLSTGEDTGVPESTGESLLSMVNGGGNY